MLSPTNVTAIGLVTNTVLSIAKIIVGLLFRSQALIADGLHSISDIITDVVVLAGVQIAEKPADSDHHYGHLRVSTLVALFVGIALFGAACLIVYNAIMALQSGARQINAILPFFVALLSIPVKEWLFRITIAVGRKHSNNALIANAWHHRTDSFTSIAAAAGLAAVAFGGPRWAFLDSVTAVVLAAFLVVMAVKIIRENADELIDRAPSTKVVDNIRQIVSETDGVQSFHACRARKVGGKVEVDIHIQVAPNLTVKQGHDIASLVKRRVMESDENVNEIIVHVEPVKE